MENQPTQPVQETPTAPVEAVPQAPADTRLPEADRKTPAEGKPGTCLRPECVCIHEHDLVAVKNADGSVSQVSTAQAKAQLDSLKQLEDQLGGQA